MTAPTGRPNAVRLVSWLLLCALACSRPSAAEPGLDPSKAIRLVRVERIIERTLTSTPIPLSPEVKSFLVPGWGQFAQRRPVVGVLFAGLEAAALGTAVVYAVRGSRAYGRYQEATDPDEARRYREQTQDADRVRNVSLVAAAVVWGLNLLDVVQAERRARKKRTVR